MVKKAPTSMNKEDMDKLIEASVEDDFAYTLFMTAKTTGRRHSEYYDVKVKDIDFDKGIMITQVLKRKKRVEKEAVLTPEVCRLLKQYIVKNKLKLDDYVFRKYSKRHNQNLVDKYAKKAGIPYRVMFHNFRHYFITELVRQGWAYNQIAKLTGHSSVGTLVHYDHAVASDIKDEALEALKNM